MKDYTVYPISNFRTGFDEATEPWLLPRDAFQVLEDSHLYRGVIEKINGYEIYAKMSYRIVVGMAGAIDGANKTFTVTLAGPLGSSNFKGFGVVVFGASAETFIFGMDSSTTLITLIGSLGGTGTIDITNPLAPIVTLIFNTAPANNTIGGVQYNAVWFAYDSIVNNLSTPGNPIMGIKPYFQANGGQQIMVFDTKRAGTINTIASFDLQSLLELDYGITEIPHQVLAANITHTPAFNGSNTTFTGSFGQFVSPGMVSFNLYTSAPALVTTIPITDDGEGALSGTNVSSGQINYLTGQWRIVFSSAPASGDTLNSSNCVYGDTFTGTASNFFDVANYQALAFITNNVDQIRYYDGSCLLLLNTNISTIVPINRITFDISRCLHVEVYRERLLLISCFVDGINAVNTIYWSKPFLPLDFTNGDFLPAPTSEPIVAETIINTDLVVRFSNSERVFRYTADAFSPFRWDSTNLIWRCDAPYSAINYDKSFTTIGKPAIVSSDGVNVKRVDEIIPDFTNPNRISLQTPAMFLNQSFIGQCYGERFDDLKEGWLCYPSSTEPQSPTSDAVLAFNYIDGTYATYSFPFSCLGYGTVINVPTWGNDFREWGSVEDTWGSFNLDVGSLVDLAGDQFGNVFQLDVSFGKGPLKTGTITGITSANPAVVTATAHGLNMGDPIIIQNVINTGVGNINNTEFIVTVIDANTFSVPFDTSTLFTYVSGGTFMTTPIALNVVSKDWNPFVEEGQLVRLGFIDLLVSANDDTTFRVQFYKDNQLDTNYSTFYQETPLTLTATGQTKVWKRIYVGAVGKEHTIRVYQNYADFSEQKYGQPVRVHAFYPYFKAAGRIFN